jgi:hypothetical protein
MEEEAGNDDGHCEVRPSGLGPGDESCCNEDGDVPNCIIAAEQPNGPDIGVACPVGDEHERARDIHYERHGTKPSHRLCFGHLLDKHPVSRPCKNTNAECCEKYSLNKGAARTPLQIPAKGNHTEECDGSVAYEIERVSFERLRAREISSDDFSATHAQVENDYQPKRSAVRRRRVRQVSGSAIIASSRHVLTSP